MLMILHEWNCHKNFISFLSRGHIFHLQYSPVAGPRVIAGKQPYAGRDCLRDSDDRDIGMDGRMDDLNMVIINSNNNRQQTEKVRLILSGALILFSDR